MTMPHFPASSTGPSSGQSSRRIDLVVPIRPLIHVANLPATTTERDLREMFGSLGQIQSAKVVTARSAGALVYGFVEYVDVASAERAIRTMDGWLWFGNPMKVCWAKYSMHPDTAVQVDHERPVASHSNTLHAHLFVGDLSPEVDDGSLQAFFSRFPSLADVRVMYDAETGKSRGFGFISFRNRHDAESCIVTMQGQWLGGRQIRVNWANQKNNKATTTHIAIGAMEVAGPSQTLTTKSTTVTPFSTHSLTPFSPAPPSLSKASSATIHPTLPRRHTGHEAYTTHAGRADAKKHTYEQVLAEAPSPSLTSVYVGNVSPLTSREDLLRIFAPFNHGQPLEARIPPGRGYGFVTLASHEQAASAICTLSIQGVFMHSRWLRFGWQKERDPTRRPYRADSAPTLALVVLNNNHGNMPKLAPDTARDPDFRPF